MNKKTQIGGVTTSNAVRIGKQGLHTEDDIALLGGIYIDTNTLHVNNVNNRVGINTKNPQVTLDVSGNLRVSGDLIIGGSSSGSGTDVSITTVGNTPNQYGMSLVAQELQLQPASSVFPGVITTTSQTFSGDKTFVGDVTVNGDAVISGQLNSSNLTGTNTGDVTIGPIIETSSVNAATISGQQLRLNVADATNPGIVSTQDQSFSGNKTFVGSISSSNFTGSSSGTNTGDITVGTVSSISVANGMDITGQELKLHLADVNYPGIMSTGTQSFAGDKTFTGTVYASNILGTNTGDVTLGSDGADLSGQVLTLHVADINNPGLMSTTAQSFAGEKTFTDSFNVSDNLIVDSTTGKVGINKIPSVELDVSGNATISNTLSVSTINSIGSTLDLACNSDVSTLNIGCSADIQTLNIGNAGTGATTINIGGTGDTVNIIGLVSTNNIVNSDISNNIITLNAGAVGAGTARGAGIQIRDDDTDDKAYIKIGNTGRTFVFRAPESATLTQYVLSTPELTADAEIFTVDPLTGDGSFTGNVSGTNLSGTNTGDITIGSVQSSSTGNAASLFGQELRLHLADANNPGLVSTSDQSISGNKTFVGSIIASNISGTNTGDITIGNVNTVATNNGASLIGQTLSLHVADDTYPGLVSTTAQSFSGDKTFVGTITSSNFSGTSSGSNSGDVTVGAVQSASTTNAMSLSGQELRLHLADATNPGLMSTVAQTFSGNKTFNGFVNVNNLTESQIVVTDVSKNLISLEYSQSAVANSIAQRDISGNIYAGNLLGTNTGDVSIGGVESIGTSNGASLVGQELRLHLADNTNPGLMSTGEQTFAGDKTFNGIINLNSLIASEIVVTDSSKNLISMGYTSDATANTIVQRDSSGNFSANGINVNNLTASELVATDSNKNLSSLPYSETSIANSIVQRDSSGNITASNFTGSSSGANTGDITIGSVQPTSTVNGASLSGQQLRLHVADGTNSGVVSTGTQTFAGDKTFIGTVSALNLSGTNTGDIFIGNTQTISTPNAASLSGQQLFLHVADAINPGLISAAAQTFGGNKTFNGTLNLDSLNASEAVVTDASKNLISLQYAQAATGNTLAQRDENGNINVVGINASGLTASEVVVTDASKNLISLAYTQSATPDTIVQRDNDGSINATNLNLSSLTASQVVITDGNKNLSSLAYSETATASSIAQRDSSGNLIATNLVGTGVNTGDVTIGTVQTTSTSNGASLSGQQLRLHIADASNAGVVSTTSQTFAGDKTFTGIVNINNLTASEVVATDASKNLISLEYAQTATANSLVQRDASGNIVANNIGTSIDVTLAGENYLSLSGQQITANPINLASSNVTGVLANSYTTATTANSANTIVQRDTSGNILANNFSGTSSGTNTGDITIGNVQASSSTFGASLFGQELRLHVADENNAGLISTDTQRFAGDKTFIGVVNIDNLTASEAIVTDASKNLISLQYSQTATANSLVQRDASGNIEANNLVDVTLAGENYLTLNGQEITANAIDLATSNVTGILPNSHTTAATTNTANSIVQRDNSGNISATNFSGISSGTNTGDVTVGSIQTSSTVNGATIVGQELRLHVADETNAGVISTTSQIFSGDKTFIGIVNIDNLTALQTVATDASKNLISLEYSQTNNADSLVQRDASGNIIATNFSGASSGTNTGDITIGAVQITSVTNGASLMGQELRLHVADEINPGLMSIGTQSFSGNKTFSGIINLDILESSKAVVTDVSKNLVSLEYSKSIVANSLVQRDVCGNIIANNLQGSNTGDITLAGENYLDISGQEITANAINLATSNVTGIIPNTNTTATTSNTANTIVARDASGNISANNLSGSNTGDVTIVGEDYLTLSGQQITINPIDLATSNITGVLPNTNTTAATENTANTIVLRDSSGNISGANFSGSSSGTNSGDITIGNVQTTSTVNGATVVGQELRLHVADENNAGVISTTSQNFSGNKTFFGTINLDTLMASEVVTTDVSKNLISLEYSQTNNANSLVQRDASGNISANNFSGLSSGTNTGDITIGSVQVTSTTNGASLLGQELRLHIADEINAGLISTGTQSFAGDKTFTGTINLDILEASKAVVTDASKNLVSLTYASTSIANSLVQRDICGNIIANNLNGFNTGDITLAGENYLDISGQEITANAINLATSHVTGVLPNTNTTATTENTANTIVLRDSSGNISGANFSGSSSGTNSGDITIGSVQTTSTANGATVVGQELRLHVADEINSGLMSTNTQIFSGDKTFNGIVNINNLTASQAVVTDVSKNLVSLEYSELAVANSIVQRDASGNINATNVTGINTGDVTLSGENYLSLSGQEIIANAINLATSNVTGVLLNSHTTATTLNTANTIVVRDISGNISATNFSGSSSGQNTGDITIGVVQTTSTSNGASLSGQQLRLHVADENNAGVVSTTSQTFAGDKTFIGVVNINNLTASQAIVTDASKNLISLEYSDTAMANSLVQRDVSGNIYATNVAGINTGDITLSGENYLSLSGQEITANSINLGSSNVTGILPNSSTTATTANAPNTIVVRDASGNISANNFSGFSSGTNTGDITIGTVQSTGTTDGASLSGQQLRLHVADASNAGIMSTGSQTFSGDKTFNGTININNLTASQTVVTDASKNLTSLEYSQTATPDSIAQRDISGNLFANNISGSNTGDITIGTVQTTSTADGATLFGQELRLHVADETNPGIMSTNTQTFAGDKTFLGIVNINNLSESEIVVTDASKNLVSIAYASTATANSIVQRDTSGNINATNVFGINTGDITLSGENYLSLTGQEISANPINLATSNVTGVLSNANTTATTANTANTIVVRDASGNISAFNLSGINTGDISIGSVQTTSTVNAASLLGQELRLHVADANNAGVVSTTSQTFAGNKTFTGILNIDSLTESEIVATDASKNLISFGYSQTATANSLVQRDASGNISSTNIAGINTGDVTLSGENYLSLSGQEIIANSVNLANSNVTGTLPNSNTTATTNNTANTIVARDASGNISASNFSGTSNGTNTGDITLGAVQTTSTTNGASLLGQQLRLHVADENNAGVVSTTSQTFAGNKVFIDVVNIDTLTALQVVATDISKNLVSLEYSQNATANTIVQRDASGNINANNIGISNDVTLVGENYLTLSGQQITANPIDLATSNVTGILSNSNTTATTSNTANTIVARDASGNISANNFTGSSSGTNSGDITLGAVQTTSAADGASLSGQQLRLHVADEINAGVVSTTSQTFAGNKTFMGIVNIDNLTASEVVVTDASKNLISLEYSQTAVAESLVQRDSSGNMIANNLSGINTGDVTIGNVQATSTANGASLSGQQLRLHVADNTNAGLVSTSAQSFAGDKTFTGTVSALNLSGTNTGDIFIGSVNTTSTANAASLSGQQLFLHVADATNPGLMSTTAQIFGGNKTFMGTVNLDSLNASEAVVTDVSKNLVSLAYSSTATTNSLAQRDGDGNLNVVGLNATSLSALEAVATDASKNLISLAYAEAATPSTLVQRDNSGRIYATSLNSSSLTGSQAVVTDGSKTLTSLAYSETATASSLAQRDASGNLIATNLVGTGINTGDITIGTIQTTSTADGASLSGQQLRLHVADENNAGVVSTTSQTFAGDKTFNGTVNINNLMASEAVVTDLSKNLVSLAYTTSAIANSLVLRDASGNINANNIGVSADVTLTGENYLDISGQEITVNPINLATSNVTGVLPNSNTTATTSNTANTIVERDTSGNISASNLSGTNTGDITIGSIQTSGTSNGASLLGQQLRLHVADTSNAGIVSTASQTFAGDKTFIGVVNINSLSASQTVVTDVSKNLISLEYSEIAIANSLAQRDTSGNIFATNIAGVNTGDVTLMGENYLDISGQKIIANQINLATSNVTGILPNTNTTATTANTASTIVLRDASGNISGTNFLGSSSGTNTGDVTITGENYLTLSGQEITVNAIDLATSNVTGILPNSHTTATTANTANTIVVRDASGNISASNFSGSTNGTNTGDITVGSVQTTSTANGASLSGQQLKLHVADATNAGLMSTTTQTFAGNKIFNGTINIDSLTASQVVVTDTSKNLVSLEYSETATANSIVQRDASGNVIGTNIVDVTLVGENYLSISGQEITANSINLATSNVTGVLPNTNTTATTANTANTIVKRDASGNISASNLSGSNTGDITIGSVQTTGTANGASLSGQQLRLHVADASNAGVVSTTSQTFAGNKTFNGTINIDSLTASQVVATDSSKNLISIEYSETATANSLVQRDASGNIIGTNIVDVSLAGENYLSISGQEITANAIDLSTSNVTGVLPNSNTTATAANTANTIVARDASGNISASNFSGSSSGTNTGDITVGSVQTTSTADGASLLGQQLRLHIADTTNAGLMSVTTQTFAGNKTFTGIINISNLSASEVVITDASKNLVSLEYSGTTTANSLVQRDASGNIFASNIAGTNTGDVTLTGENFLSISGQEITVDPINLATSNVTGVLPNSNTTATTLNTASTIVERDASGNISANNFSGSSSGTNTDDITIGSVQTTSTANAASLSGQQLRLHVADSSNAGLVSTSAQTFAGDKTFSGIVNINSLTTSQIVATDASKNLISLEYSETATSNSIVQRDASGNIIGTNIIDVTLAGENYLSISGQEITANAINLATSNVTGILSNSNTTATTANTANTIVERDASGNISATNLSGTNTGDITIGSVQNTSTASGASLSGQQLRLHVADSSNAGLMSTTAQTFAGNKTFTGVVNISNLTASQVVITDASKNLVSLEYSETATANSIAQRDASGNIFATNIVDVTLAGENYLSINGQEITANSINLATSNVTGILPNSNTTATTSNTANTIVERDASGNISANNFSGSSSGTNTGDITIGSVQTTSTANSASLSGQQLRLHVADSSNAGVVSTTSQTFAGNKTFNGIININNLAALQAVVTDTSKNLVSLEYSESATANTLVLRDASGNVLGTNIVDVTLAGENYLTINGQEITANAIDLSTSNVTGILSNLNTTATTSNTANTIVQRDASGNISALNLSGTNTGDITIGSVQNISTANGASLSGQQLLLHVADGTNAGLVSTGTQTFSGNKTFNGTINFNSLTASEVVATDASKNLVSLEYSQSSTANSLVQRDVSGNITGTNIVGLNTGDVTLTGENYLSISGQEITVAAVNLATSNVTGILPNTNTTATTANTASTIVLRDTSGNISANNFSGSSSGTNTGDITIGSVQTTSTANGASLSGQQLRLHVADASNAGIISTGTQTFAGDKTFNGIVNIDNLIASKVVITDASKNLVSLEYSQVATANSLVQRDVSGNIIGTNISGINTGDITLTGENYLSISGQEITANSIDLATSNVTGILPNSNTTATTANTSNTIVARDASGNISATNFSGSSSGTNTGDITIGSVQTSSTANGASLSGQQLRLHVADVTNAGVVSTTSQTFAGDKTFTGIVNIDSLTALQVAATDISKNLVSLEYSESATPNSLVQRDVSGNIFATNIIDVTLSGENYLSISGQEITANPIDLATSNVTGVLPNSNTTATTLSTANTIVLRDASGNISTNNLSGTNTGDITLGTVGSSPNANAASLSGQVLTFQVADASNPGLMSTTTQSFAGDKTFTGTITAFNLSGTNTGDITIGTIQTSSTANGASLSGQQLRLHVADNINAGLVSTTSQTFAGDKTFAGIVNINNLTSSQVVVTDASKNLVSLEYSDSAIPNTLVQRDASGNINANNIGASNDVTLVGENYLDISGQEITAHPIDLATSNVTGILPNTNTTATILNTADTIVLRDSSGNMSANNFSGNSSGTNTGDITIGSVQATSTALAASLSGQQLRLHVADGTNSGVVSTTSQTFAGDKTFTGIIAASNLSGTNTGDITVGTVNATSTANGVDVSGQVLTLHYADGTNPGLLSATTQSIGGDKTFTGNISASNFSGSSSGTNTGDITIGSVQAVSTSGAASLSGQQIRLHVADGTNAGLVSTTTQTFAGDKTFTGTIGASNLSGTNTGDITIGSVQATSTASAASLSGQQLRLHVADGTNAGVVSTTTQTFAGDKTFSGTINLSGLTASQAVVTDASKNLISLAYATAATASTLAQRDASGSLNVVNLNASALTAFSLVASDGSKNLTSTVSGLSPGFTGLSLSGLTASQAVVTDASKNLASLAYSQTAAASSIAQRDASGNIVANNISGTNTGDITIGVVQTTSTANAASLSGQQLRLHVADGTNAGIVSTTTQTFAGNKTFSGTLTLSGLSASQAVVTDVSSNLTSLAFSTSATASTLAQRDASGSINVVNLNASALTASSLVASDGSKNLTSSVSGLSPAFTGLNLSGLTASQTVVTDGSKNLASLSYTTAATASTLAQRDASGSLNVVNLNASALTASSLVASDASKNLTSTVSGLSPAFTGLTLSGLTASQAVVTNASKNLASLSYTTAATASTLAQRDASGSLNVVNLNASALTASSLVASDGSKNLTSTVSGLSPAFTGLTLSGLTASQVVVTNASKNLASLAYSQTATASSIAQRDASGNIIAGNISGTNTGDITIGAVQTTSTTNAASLSGQQLRLHVADGSNAGIISTTAQTIAGVKLFNTLPVQLGTSTDTSGTRFITALDSTMTAATSRYIAFGKANSSYNQAELVYTHNVDDAPTLASSTITANTLTLGFNGQANLYLDTYNRFGIGTTPYTSLTASTYTATSTFTIPSGCTRVYVKMWGSGGGGGSGNGTPQGGGGACIVSYVTVVAGDNYTLTIGQAGQSSSASGRGAGTGHGEGGAPGFFTTDYNGRGGGGQYTALHKNNGSSYTLILAAGGGGGGGLSSGTTNGSAGGGAQNAADTTYGGKTPTPSGSGNAGAAGGGTNGSAGEAYGVLTQTNLADFGGNGGTPVTNSRAGGGGGGYGGGGSGGVDGGGVSSGGGAGGGSYAPNGTIYPGALRVPGNTSDADYTGSYGYGGAGTSSTGSFGGNGTDGYAKIYFITDYVVTVSGNTITQGNMIPYTDNTYNLGSSSSKWASIYATSLNLNGLTASSLVATDASKNLISSNLSGDVSSSGLVTTIGASKVTNSMLAGSITDSKLNQITTASKVATSALTGTVTNDVSATNITVTNLSIGSGPAAFTVSSTMPIYGCRAWVVFNGTSSTPITPLVASSNISTVDRVVTGVYKITFSSAFPSANYCVMVSASRNGVPSGGRSDCSAGVIVDDVTYTGRTTTYCHIFTSFGSSAYYNDKDINVSIFF